MKQASFFQDLQNRKIDRIPDQCPMCHVSVNPNFVIGYSFFKDREERYRIVFTCTNAKCSEIFFGVYLKDQFNFRDDVFYLRGCSPFQPFPESFEECIEELSPSFVEIYNQAKHAEERRLDQICGVGYRKALEFLIKDYAITLQPEKVENIKKEPLAAVISNYILNQRIKEISKRAVWLGNDETHYVRRWENKDIDDLKLLIKLTINWISLELLSSKYEEDMN
ncbi:hypothetical protein CDO73_23815 [Saccharibacillus sp. O23]|uniref:DUF4145 domain-containing protein n=1 Tax=Saccharibacillus sp. O23 TaxID=2009338 RepID=UPI000B4E4F91|nr:DUF4145 domain-containing protein [Saccharibacillus sp. O23]OWR27271.1 hypothetical protein CDO73_23815 [Saccharibacillus sp. O23]